MDLDTKEIESLANDLKMPVKALNKTLAIRGFDHQYALWSKKEIEEHYNWAVKANDGMAIEIIKKLKKNRQIFDKVKNNLLTRKIERNPRRSVKDIKFLNWIIQFEKHIDKIIKTINQHTDEGLALIYIVPIQKYPAIPKYVYEKIAYMKLLLTLQIQF